MDSASGSLRLRWPGLSARVVATAALPSATPVVQLPGFEVRVARANSEYSVVRSAEEFLELYHQLDLPESGGFPSQHDLGLVSHGWSSQASQSANELDSTARVSDSVVVARLDRWLGHHVLHDHAEAVLDPGSETHAVVMQFLNCHAGAGDVEYQPDLLVLAPLGIAKDAVVDALDVVYNNKATDPCFGRCGNVYVVVTSCPPGHVHAENRVQRMLADYSSITKVVLCGVAGGVPRMSEPERHVRLGDVVVLQASLVSEPCVYELDGNKRELSFSMNDSPLMAMASREIVNKERFYHAVDRGLVISNARRPNSRTTDEHEYDGLLGRLERHPERTHVDPDRPMAHFGAVGCVGQVNKVSAKQRDEWARKREKLRCIDTETFGVAHSVQCWQHTLDFLVVRGIMDYAQVPAEYETEKLREVQMKRQVWQQYAAVAAAAALRVVLRKLPPRTSLPVPVSSLAPRPGRIIWSVPPRHTHFVGRRRLLSASHKESMLRLMIAKAPRQPVVIYGVSGVGKTELAIEYCHRHANWYSSSRYDALVWWIDASSTLTVELAYRSFALQIAAANLAVTDTDRVISLVHKRMAAFSSWLVVLDNIPAADVSKGLIDRYAPPRTRFGHHVLATVRADLGAGGMALQAPQGIVPLPLLPLSPDNAAMLLFRLTYGVPPLAGRAAERADSIGEAVAEHAASALAAASAFGTSAAAASINSVSSLADDAAPPEFMRNARIVANRLACLPLPLTIAAAALRRGSAQARAAVVAGLGTAEGVSGQEQADQLLEQVARRALDHGVEDIARKEASVELAMTAQRLILDRCSWVHCCDIPLTLLRDPAQEPAIARHAEAALLSLRAAGLIMLDRSPVYTSIPKLLRRVYEDSRDYTANSFISETGGRAAPAVPRFTLTSEDIPEGGSVAVSPFDTSAWLDHHSTVSVHPLVQHVGRRRAISAVAAAAQGRPPPALQRVARDAVRCVLAELRDADTVAGLIGYLPHLHSLADASAKYKGQMRRVLQALRLVSQIVRAAVMFERVRRFVAVDQRQRIRQLRAALVLDAETLAVTNSDEYIGTCTGIVRSIATLEEDQPDRASPSRRRSVGRHTRRRSMSLRRHTRTDSTLSSASTSVAREPAPGTESLPIVDLKHTQMGMWRLGERVGATDRAHLYAVYMIDTTDVSAIGVVERVQEDAPLSVEAEHDVLTELLDCQCAPILHDYEVDDHHAMMVIENMGKSVQAMFEEEGRRFSEATILRIGHRVVDLLESAHRMGWIHRRIQPQTICLGSDGAAANQLYLVDWSEARAFRDAVHQHVRQRRIRRLAGPAQWASVSTMKRHSYSRRDDLMMLCYTLAYLRCGCLPWDSAGTLEEIRNSKESSEPSVICGSRTSDDWLAALLLSVSSLSFDAVPAYDYYRGLMEEAAATLRVQITVPWSMAELRDAEQPRTDAVAEGRHARTFVAVGLETRLHGTLYVRRLIRNDMFVMVNERGVLFRVKAARSDSARGNAIEQEAAVYQYLADNNVNAAPGLVPLVTSRTAGYSTLVLAHAGMTLDDWRRRLPLQCLSSGAVLKVGVEVLDLLHRLHNAGYVHGGLTPDNIVVAYGDRRKLQLIDFKYALQFRSADNGMRHRSIASGVAVPASIAKWASIHRHRGRTPCRRDDIESLVYVMASLHSADLPWSPLAVQPGSTVHKAVRMVMEQTTAKEICRRLPSAVADLLAYARSMRYDEKPKYNAWRNRLIAAAEQAQVPLEFDWVLDGVAAAASEQQPQSSG